MKLSRSLALPALLLLTAIVYSPVLEHEFVHYDDPGYVFQNENVRNGFSVQGIRWALTSGEQSNWHPLTWFSHMLDAQLFGVARPGLHHLTNLLLHLLNTFLVFGVFVRLTRREGISLWIAAVFAPHPLHIESVAWIAERKDLLSATFWLASTWAYIGYARNGSRGRYSLCLLLLAFGLASKPMVVTAPFLFLLLDAWPLGRLSRRAVAEKLPMLALVLVASIVTYQVQSAWGSVWSPPWSHRIATALTGYVRYCGKFFWPDPLAVLYPSHVGMWSIPQVAGSTALLLVITGLLIRFRRVPAGLVGWLWFLGTLVPVIGIVTVGRQSIADRYTYIPILGLALSLSWIVEELRGGRGGARAAWALGILTLAAMTARTARHLPNWQDSPTLFRHALAVTTDNDIMHNNLGTWLFEQGQVQEAAQEYRTALSIRDDYPRTRINLILALDALEQYDAAVEQIEIQLARTPGDLELRGRAGRTLRLAGRPREALAHYEKFLSAAPNDPVVWNNQGGAQLDLLQLDEAIASFRRAIELNPKYTLAHRNLAAALLRAGRKDEALAHLEDVLRGDPSQSGLRELAARIRAASD